MTRIPIIRKDKDGTVIDGTARYTEQDAGHTIDDFRDLDGKPLDLPPGSWFELPIISWPSA